MRYIMVFKIGYMAYFCYFWVLISTFFLKIRSIIWDMFTDLYQVYIKDTTTVPE